MSQHPIWPLPISPNHGQLILTPAPGSKGTDLTSSLDQLQQAECKLVISLMPSDELDRNGLADLKSQCEQRGMQWLQLAIDDDQAPTDSFEEALDQAWPVIDLHLNEQQNIAVHCKGGSGRTGLMAARILLRHGWTLAQAKASIQALRPNALCIQPHCDYIKKFA